MKTNLKIQPPTSSHPVLRFTPTAWAKLLALRDAGESEIGGFGVAATDDLLLVEQIVLVRQTASWCHVNFNDQAVADHFDAQVDAGRQPESFARIWIHTHPGKSAQPSQTDEKTFGRVFGGADWAVMFILARGGQTYARLRYNVGPGSDVPLSVEVDYRRPFGGSDEALWLEEYETLVEVPADELVLSASVQEGMFGADEDAEELAEWYEDWYELPIDRHAREEAEYGYSRDFD